MPKVDSLFSLLLTIFDLLLDALRFIRLSLQPRCTLAAENLFLRKQLGLYLERQVEPRRPRAAAKLTWYCFPDSFLGDTLLLSSSRTHSSAGISKAFDCSGSGNRGPAGGLEFLPNSRN